MSKPMNINVRVGETLSQFISHKIGDHGTYENVSEYIRDLIRRDREVAAREMFLLKKAELQKAFNVSESDFQTLTAEDYFARKKSKR